MIIGELESLRVNGSDLVIGSAIIDSDGNAVTSGQTVKFNVQQLSDSKWWNTSTSAFDLSSEPTLISASQVDFLGVYEYTLSGGYDSTETGYRVRVEAVGIVNYDFYFTDAPSVSSSNNVDFLQLIVSTVINSNKLLKAILGLSEEEQKQYKNLYSAIRDMRRELLRGKSIDRRKL